MLAILLLNVGQTVSIERLAEAVWGQPLPASGRNAIQGYVSRLRRLLGRMGDTVVSTSAPGYRLDLDPSRVDLYLAQRLISRARESDDEEAERLLRQAQRLWIGPSLGGAAGDWLHGTYRVALEEARLSRIEERIEIEVRLGRLAGPLGTDAAAFPAPPRDREWWFGACSAGRPHATHCVSRRCSWWATSSPRVAPALMAGRPADRDLTTGRVLPPHVRW